MATDTPVPHFKKIGTYNFVSGNYATDLTYPNNGLPSDVYSKFYLDVNGTLTTSAGTTDGVPSPDGVKALIDSFEINPSGKNLKDSFIVQKMKDLQVWEQVLNRDVHSLPVENNILSGANQTTLFRGFYGITMLMKDTRKPFLSILPVNRTTQTTIRCKFGTGNMLVSPGASQVCAISACTADLYGEDYSGEPNISLNKDLMFFQRNMAMQVGINATSRNNQDYYIPKTNAYLRALMVYQYYTDVNGNEIPTNQLIRPTDQVSLLVDGNKKFEYTWEQLTFKNTEDYKQPLPLGYSIIDMSPRGDLDVIKKMNLALFNDVRLRIDNGSVANGFIRINQAKMAAFGN